MTLFSPTPLGFFKGIGPLGNESGNFQNASESIPLFAKIISVAVGVMTIVAFIWFVFVIITGAVSWLSSGGDKAKLQEAQKKLTTGIVGAIIVISALFLIKLVGTIFGINILGITDLIVGLWQ